MIKIIDQYIFKKFISTLFIVLTAFIIIFVIVNIIDFLDKFRDKIGEAYESVENQIDKTPWGYKLKKQVVESGGQEFRSTEPIKDFMKKSTGEQVARATAGLTTGDAQKALYKATNIPIIQQEILNDIPARVGVNARDDKLAGAIIARGAPFLGAYLAGRAGGVGEGFRPKGEKAVYPKSKKEDPTGREVGNPLAEGIGRSVFFQRGQMLPYGEFKKERPDVMPSTYRDYMAYQYAKPEAGSLVTIDPRQHKALPHRRYHGKVGIVKEVGRRTVILNVKLGDKTKTLITRLDHIKPFGV